MTPARLLLSLLTALALLPWRLSAIAPATTCRSYCGNVTVDYPFAVRPGCGHPGFRDLLFCINGFLMLHLPSGSYRVVDLDYGYRALTLHDPDMSTCRSLVRPPAATGGSAGNGFVVEPWRTPYLEPAPDNVFMLLSCRAGSPLFEGFPGTHLPCRRDVAGMGCEGYYGCPAWEHVPGARGEASPYGAATPPPCCAVPYGAIRAINLTRLGCQGYSSAYSLAPVREVGGAMGWLYGIRVRYSVPAEHEEACRACEATGGACGHDDGDAAVAGGGGRGRICLCGGWNSTSNCDSGKRKPAPANHDRTPSTGDMNLLCTHLFS